MTVERKGDGKKSVIKKEYHNIRGMDAQQCHLFLILVFWAREEPGMRQVSSYFISRYLNFLFIIIVVVKQKEAPSCFSQSSSIGLVESENSFQILATTFSTCLSFQSCF